MRDTNTANGNEGADTFFSIEFAQFADGDIKLSFQNNGEFQVNTYTASFQENPAIAALNDGSFVVIWESYQQDPDPSNSASSIYAQRYNANGRALGNEFRVNTHINGDQFKPSITALTDGGFVIAWEGGKGFSRPDIDAQRYDVNGVKQGGEFQVNTHTTGGQTDPAITALTNGGFVVAWTSEGQDGGSSTDRGVYAQSYNFNGNRAG